MAKNVFKRVMLYLLAIIAVVSTAIPVNATTLFDITAYVETINSLPPLLDGISGLLPAAQHLTLGIITLIGVIMIGIGFVVLIVAILNPHTYASMFDYLMRHIFQRKG